MRKKITGLFVCLLVISTIVIPVASLTDRKDYLRAISNSADVPTWKKGDEWTYYFTESATLDPVFYLSGDLTLKVLDDSGDSYVLEGTTNPDGKISLGTIGLKTTRFTSYSMRIQMRKTDLALENYREKYKGFLLLTVGPVTLPIPLQIVGQRSNEFDPAWAIMPFPLFDGKLGNLSSVEILQNNSFGLLWGLISVLKSKFVTPLTPVPYTCSEEQITVQGNTFDVYNISAEWMEGSRFVSYYSEEVGNVVKEVIYIPVGGGRIYYSILLELKDWSYMP